MSDLHDENSQVPCEDDSDGTIAGTSTPRPTGQAGSSFTTWSDNYAQAFIAAIADDVSTVLDEAEDPKPSEQERKALLTMLNDETTAVDALIAGKTDDLDRAISFSVKAIGPWRDPEEDRYKLEFHSRYQIAGSATEFILPTVTCYVDAIQSEDGSEVYGDIDFTVDEGDAPCS